MRAQARMMMAACLLALPLLSGCGGEEKSSTKVQMKDMEVVDGTATDAMTDLDGVQSESAPPAGNVASANAATATEAEAPADAEVVSDQ